MNQPITITCQHCRGTGHFGQYHCNRCRGRGWIFSPLPMPQEYWVQVRTT